MTLTPTMIEFCVFVVSWSHFWPSVGKWVTYETILKNILFLALWQDLSQEASLTHGRLDATGWLTRRTPDWSKEPERRNFNSSSFLGLRRLADNVAAHYRRPLF